ncbi:hypothetical protein AVEN_225855-1 [Araneus ventricosus]|uniref:SOCS box domain-containing protein n=1 Tax=Araneus ventricosus TaxID=182803 RepID=A0A4Y2BCW6_ARAVE|nr:hypothetical protein AVEN_225855-1 [Araneus ventricosus]
MVVHFYDKIQLQLVKLREARDVAAVSFKYHKSVDHLDLSTNEYGLRKKSIFTEEGIRKWIQPRTQILYKYNLELPTDLQKYYSKEKFDIVREDTFHQYKIFVCYSVYNFRFETYIVRAINFQRTNKIEKLRRSMKIIKLLNFYRFSASAMYLYDNILPILIREGCRDPKLVVNFANLFSFYLWITQREDPHILQYVLAAAQKVGPSLSLSLFAELSMDPVNACFLLHKIGHVPVLLRFGAPSAFPRTLNINYLLKLTERLLHRSFLRRSADQRRAFFLLQLCYDFRYHRNSPEGLRCIWKCVNDPFLSITEIASAVSTTHRQQSVASLIAYYQHLIIGKVCSYEPSPRTLKDICRVEVRRLLNFNHQLPFGVNNLNIPNELKLYLNLFI